MKLCLAGVTLKSLLFVYILSAGRKLVAECYSTTSNRCTFQVDVFIDLKYSCNRKQQDTKQEAVVLEVDVVDNDEAGVAKQQQLQDGCWGAPAQPPAATLAHPTRTQVLTAPSVQQHIRIYFNNSHYKLSKNTIERKKG